MTRKSPFHIELSVDEKAELNRRATKYTLPYFEVVRAKMILMAAAKTDRLVHHSTIFEMNVQSYRRRAAIERKQTGPGRPASYATTKNVGALKPSDNQPPA